MSAEPPQGLLRKVAEREGANAEARANYTYRQSFTLQELNSQGSVMGEYQEIRDITYSPQKGRTEQLVGKPSNTLAGLKLTAEDFEDVSKVASLLLTPDQVSLYEGQYKGEETKDGELCFVEYVRPKQILSGQRFFQGMLWIRESDFSIVRSEGQAVPQLESTKTQNLFPHFTTLRKPVDNQWLFPVQTIADDTLFFRNWPQRIRVNIRYSSYQRFGSESTVTYGDGSNNAAPPSQPPPKP
jgi:hypothetical protein